MFIITYDKQEGAYIYRNIVETFDDKVKANNRWVELRRDVTVVNMRPSTTEGPEQYIAVQVVFSNYGKRYTYLAKEPVEIGQLVVVRTADGLQVVTCVSCNRVTRSQLELVLPFSKYKYITGKVV